MKKKKRKVKRVSHAKKKFAYKIIIILFLILFFILLGKIMFFVLEKISEPEKETGLKGKLATLKWDFGKEDVILDVLGYSIVNDNQTAEVNINWSSGNKSVNAVFIDFIGILGGCNYTKINDLSFGENKTYTIDFIDVVCSESSFANVTDIEAYAQININLTQIALIPNITIYNDDSLTDVIDFDNYFSCLVNISYFVIGDLEDRIGIVINETTHLVSFNPRLDRHGTYEFNLTAISDDGDVLNVTTNGKNMSFYVVFINGTRYLQNYVPRFLDVCKDIEWQVNTSYILNMKTCWSDEDGDSLTFRYENTSNINLSISRSGSDLTLTPSTNWNGTGYFYVYASDGKNETQGRVDFRVFKIVNITANQTNITANITTNQTNITANITTNQTNLTANNTPKIKSPSPSSEKINISSNESLEFSITAENYDSIKWYVDGVLIKSDVSSYTAGNLSEGEHEIKVEVGKGSEKIYKTWNLSVSGEETPKKDFFVYFVIILVGVGILILIVVFFIVKNMMEKKEESRERPVIKELKPGIRISYIPPSKPSSYSR